MKQRGLLLMATLITAVALGAGTGWGFTRDLEGRAAPSLEGGAGWINSEPLSLEQLRSHVVLLDFWTYGCINCRHAIAELEPVRAKYAHRPFLTIGVHSPEFEHEKKMENVRSAVDRLGITYPVVLDNDYAIWRRYENRYWPTLVLIDGSGAVRKTFFGEGNHGEIDQLAGLLLDELKGEVPRAWVRPAVVPPEGAAALTALRYPAKVLAREGRLFIADTNHHRILQATLDGRVEQVFGSGDKGDQDGPVGQARFAFPRGMTLYEESLYVADTGNHRIRRVDLRRGVVETVVGTGEKGDQTGKALEAMLVSPWDLEYWEGRLFIANAGNHKIKVYDPARQEVADFVGSGREGMQDGIGVFTSMGQPSGLTRAGSILFVADAEMNALRMIDTTSRLLFTLAGKGYMRYGAEDGIGDDASFQHPLGVAARGGLVYVADTYNNRIRVVDPEKRLVATAAGTGEEGNRDGSLSEAQFREPMGLSFWDEKLYVADTGNHAIRVVDLTGGAVRTLQLRVSEEHTLHRGQRGRVLLTVGLAPHLDWSGEVPLRVSLEAVPFLSPPEQELAFAEVPPSIPIVFTVSEDAPPGPLPLALSLQLSFCHKEEGYCVQKSDRLPLWVRIVEGDPNREASVPLHYYLDEPGISSH